MLAVRSAARCTRQTVGVVGLLSFRSSPSQWLGAGALAALSLFLRCTLHSTAISVLSLAISGRDLRLRRNGWELELALRARC